MYDCSLSLIIYISDQTDMELNFETQEILNIHIIYYAINLLYELSSAAIVSFSNYDPSLYWQSS